jgi:hypothetical protein
MSIDIRIPDSGWDKPEWRDDGSDPDMLDALAGPMPRWVRDLTYRAQQAHCNIYLHPTQFYALLQANWNDYLAPLDPFWIFGVEVFVDRAVPEDVARLRLRLDTHQH